jgi:hypothetical protein
LKNFGAKPIGCENIFPYLVTLEKIFYFKLTPRVNICESEMIFGEKNHRVERYFKGAS